MPCLYVTVIAVKKLATAGNQVYLWQGIMLMACPALKNDAHVHFPASLYIGLDKDLSVTTDTGPVTGRVVLVRANSQQSADSHGGPLLDLLVDADSDAYRYLEPLLLERDAVILSLQQVEAVLPRCRQTLAGELSCEQAWALSEELLISLSAYRASRPAFDARVEQVALGLRAELPVNPDIASLAAQAGVSESRFMHLFKQQYGLPVRQYLLWARLRRAAELWQQGLSLTEIATDVGFYDQAHFTRTVRRMFDFAPSWLANPENVNLHNCSC